MRLPARAARQLPDQSTTLQVDSSSTDDSRLRGALRSAAKRSLLDHLVGATRYWKWDSEAERLGGLEVQ
jgi:hypothetical protein